MNISGVEEEEVKGGTQVSTFLASILPAFPEEVFGKGGIGGGEAVGIA